MAIDLRLGCRPPYGFEALLDFLRPRALPGLEVVDEGSYARLLGPPDAPGCMRVTAGAGGEHALRLEVHGPLSAPADPQGASAPYSGGWLGGGPAK